MTLLHLRTAVCKAPATAARRSSRAQKLGWRLCCQLHTFRDRSFYEVIEVLAGIDVDVAADGRLTLLSYGNRTVVGADFQPFVDGHGFGGNAGFEVQGAAPAGGVDAGGRGAEWRIETAVLR